MLFLFRRDRRVFAAAGFFAVLMTYFYALHLSCVSLEVRTALASQYGLVAVSAVGFAGLARLLASRGELAAHVLLGVVLCAVPFTHRDFLRRDYTEQQEFRLLLASIRALPREAIVVFLSEEDDAGLLQERGFQRELILHEAREGSKFLVPMGIRRFFSLLGEFDPEGAFIFLGTPCYSVPWTNAEPGDRMGLMPGYVHPLCARVSELFVLEPVVTADVTNLPLSWDAIEGESRTMGLYRIGGLRAASVPGGKELPSRPSDWILVAVHARDAGRPALARAALRRAARGANPAEAARIAMLEKELEGERPASSSGTDESEESGIMQPVKDPFYISPGDQAVLKRALAAFAAGDLRTGFIEYRRVVRVSSLKTYWPVESYCRARRASCVPMERALKRLEGLNVSGIEAFQKGDIAAASRLFGEALSLDPQDLDSLLNAAAVRSAAGELEAALALYDRALRLRPAKDGVLSDILSFRASVLEKAGRKEEAGQDLRRALDEASSDWAGRVSAAERLRKL